MPWQLSWRCWSRKLRIAATGASTDCAGSSGCPRARPGKPPSSRGQALRAQPSPPGYEAATGQGQLCRARHQRAGLRTARHRQDPRPVRPGPPPGGSPPLRPLRSGLPPGAGTARRQARPGPASATAQAGQLRLPAPRRPGLPAPGRRGVRGPLHPDRRTLRAPVAGHHVKPGLLGVGTHLCQPHGHRRGHRSSGAPLRHPGV